MGLVIYRVGQNRHLGKGLGFCNRVKTEEISGYMEEGVISEQLEWASLTLWANQGLLQ